MNTFVLYTSTADLSVHLRIVDSGDRSLRTQWKHSSPVVTVAAQKWQTHCTRGPTGNLHRMTSVFWENWMMTSLFGDSTVSLGLNVLLLLKSRIWIWGSHLLEPTCERGGMFTGLHVTLTFHLPSSLVFLLLYQVKYSSTQTHYSHNPAVIYYNGGFDSILLLIYMVLDFLVLCDYAGPLILWYS